MVGAAVLTGGSASPLASAVGTAIGNSAGLYGAAATSYGLALLGGGSLAAGGSGMLGGGLLLMAVAKATTTVGTRAAAAVIAKQSPAAFIHELAKLDVRCQVDPRLASNVLNGLRALHELLERSLADLKATERSRMGVPSKEARNLASSIRATEYEIRHLSSPAWKRAAARVPRVINMPVLSKVLDVFD